MTLRRDQEIPVTLSAEQWEIVLRALAELPHRIADPLISDVRRQCLSAAEEVGHG